MVAAATSANSTLDFVQTVQSAADNSLIDENKTNASFSSENLHYCQQCHQSFTSSKMLQTHNQTMHADKAFICEICGKAFRFRSNLAEHRSVHTAVKPFVCKFCGKSSRLKGNLTKHILKHHKTEQIDYVGKDDIIIKKGKKSVKDPMAIDFLEKSMIVLQSAANTASAARAGLNVNGTSQSWNDSGINEEEHGFLMSLGLDSGSIDLKADSPDGSCAGTSQASSMNLGEHQNQSYYNNTIDQPFKMEIDEEDEAEENNHLLENQNDTRSNDENEQDVNENDYTRSREDFDNAKNVSTILATLNNSAVKQNNNNNNNNNVPITNNSKLTSSSAALAAAACKALLFGNVAAAVVAAGKKTSPSDNLNYDDSNNNHNNNNNNNISSTNNENEDSDESGSRATSASNLVNQNNIIRKTNNNNYLQSYSTTNGNVNSNRLSSQCTECGKHLRKPRDLIAHLATIHKIFPSSSGSSVNLNGYTSPKSNAINNNSINIGNSGTANAVNELRQLRQLVGDIKNGASNSSVNSNNVTNLNSRLEQLVLNLDNRVGRLEKQLEMALNSIYTLVQLQTGINNQLTRFRDETADQLRNVVNLFSSSPLPSLQN